MIILNKFDSDSEHTFLPYVAFFSKMCILRLIWTDHHTFFIIWQCNTLIVLFRLNIYWFYLECLSKEKTARPSFDEILSEFQPNGKIYLFLTIFMIPP